MHFDVLVAEIGSTTTVVNAFEGIHNNKPVFKGQGQAPTSVKEGDVNIGLQQAIDSLSKNLGVDSVEYGELLATSSAAGGLRMSVHGLVYDMTVRAAKEAALGAGGILKNVTAGKLRRTDIAKIKEVDPNIILVAGGVDYGERDTALDNFELLTSACPNIPFIYAGNIQNQDEIKLIAEEKDIDLYIVDNVYPAIDTLNVEPTRKVIQDAFEEHITKASGMSKIRDMVTGRIVPTPGAVMESSKLLYEIYGDLIVFDVGGATTDLHSVTNGSEECNEILISPEPFAKRTVEGDLGVYVNIPQIVEYYGIEKLREKFPDADNLIKNAKAIPDTKEQLDFIEFLTEIAITTALDRHAGKLIDYYGATGKKVVATGKDLTAVKYIVGTGGALTRLPHRVEIMEKTLSDPKSNKLTPRYGTKILIDNHYIMASIGVLSLTYKEQAKQLLLNSILNK